ncbi:MAG: winged helix-turn-helix transcriptional regulator [Solirubrobacterales bacterium]|nr:winged helix-turn-helix transcriptional regulator [Solirubrobacterales bacterium]
MSAVDDDLWAAVAEPSRRRLLDALLARPGATASALTADVALTRQAIAKHLDVLESAGLVAAVRVGREVRYSVQAERMTEASQALRDAGARWGARLAAIKAVAEQLASEDQA